MSGGCTENTGGESGAFRGLLEPFTNLRDAARACAEVNTHACCYTFARLWGGNSLLMKIEACRLPAHLCIHYIQAFFSAGNPP